MRRSRTDEASVNVCEHRGLRTIIRASDGTGIGTACATCGRPIGSWGQEMLPKPKTKRKKPVPMELFPSEKREGPRKP